MVRPPCKPSALSVFSIIRVFVWLTRGMFGLASEASDRLHLMMLKAMGKSIT